MRITRSAGIKRSWFLAGAIALLAAASGSPAAADPAKITVFAAASLREAFEAAVSAFSAKTGITVTLNFGGSDTLAAQIAQGAPADVFASANAAQMTKVADAGLLASTATTFARNRLIVIVPKANPAGVRSAADLGRPGIKLVLGAATVPVGKYARAAISAMSTKDGLPAGFADAVEKNVVSNELDVKAVATKVSLGEADAGVVYVTDVTPAIATTVSTIAFPVAANVDAIYPIAALKAAPNGSGAQAFVTFMLGDGQTYLKARGFLSP